MPKVRRSPLPMALLVGIGLVGLSACVVNRTSVRQVGPGEGSAEPVKTPLRVHMWDGTTVVFRDGASVGRDEVFSALPGIRYDLRLRETDTLLAVPMDSIAAIEVYTDVVRGVETVMLTSLGVAATAVGVVAAAVIIFGSCPTVYAETPAGPELQAEAFSYAIAPSFEHWDMAPLAVTVGEDGAVRIGVRNEALETHYINTLQVRAVSHAARETAFAGTDMDVYVAGDVIAPARATDRDGRSAASALREADDDAFRTSPTRLAAATEEDSDDFVELEFPIAAATDSALLTLRLRNTLLTTVLFYDAMLADQGPGAVRWLGETVNDRVEALDLYLWTRRHLGLRLSVWDGGGYVPVTRIRDTGPLAWRELAVPLPVLTPGRLRVRLDYLADAWLIDRAGVAADWRRADAASLPLSRVIEPDGRRNPEARDALSEADDHYLETRPGQSMTLAFDAGFARRARDERPARSFFLASRGYYTEWIRRDWLLAERPRRFDPGVGTLGRVLELWRERKAGIERDFFATRVEAAR